MKMKKISIAVAAIVVSASASAQWAVYDAQVARGVQSVVDALRNSGQANAAVQSKATEQVANAVTDAHATDAMRRAERDYQIQDACGAIAGTRGLANAGRVNAPNVARSGRGGGRRMGGAPSGATGAMNKALNIANGVDQPPPVEVQASLGVEATCDNFVDPASVRGQACVSAGRKNPGTRVGVEKNSDIMASSLFNGAVRLGETPRNKLTFQADDSNPEFYTVAALRRHLWSPLELRALTAGELQTGPGRQFTTLKDSYEARTSMAQSQFQSVLENRTENMATATAVDQLLNSPVMAAYTQNYLDVNGLQNWRARGISRDELMQLEVERRYMNIDWHKNLASQPGDPVMKELVVMAAHDKVMMWRMIQRLDEMGVVLGQIAGTLNRLEMTPQLNALHGAATSANR